MNEKAEELGCSDTLYSNPTWTRCGRLLSSDAHSTAADVGIVVSYAMENDLFREIVDAADTSTRRTGRAGSSNRGICFCVSTDELIGVYGADPA